MTEVRSKMKGLLQSLEAIIGILLILSVFVAVYSRDVQLPELETTNFKVKGFSALKAVDSTGELRRFALSNDTASIGNKTSDLLPKHLNVHVIVCETECYAPDIGSEKLASVTYLVAGDVNDIRPRQVLLYMWLP